MHRIFLSLICVFCFSTFAFSQDHGHEHGDDHSGHQHAAQEEGLPGHDEGLHGCAAHEEAEFFNPGNTAFHHISDQNIYNVGPWSLPLPCILYSSDMGLSVFSSGKFHTDAHGHGNGHVAVDGYVLIDGLVRRVLDKNFPKGEVEIDNHGFHATVDSEKGPKEVPAICYEGQLYPTESRSYADGGLFGGGISSFYDFSITKNVVTMIIVFLFMAWMFFSVAKAYTKRDGQAPKGLQSFIEPIFLFIQDEVAKPFLGHKWEKYLPFLMALFFFILGLNLFGQIPIFGGSNVTGNLAVTMVLAVITFFVVNLSGNAHYWGHTLWMPGVPPLLKILIITPVEILGLFIKPITLMLRLFANITAGHMVMVIFVGLIFLFGQNNAAPSYGTAVGSTLLTIFMMSIELLVAFIQAFVFTILTASYIGAATEEAHH